MNLHIIKEYDTKSDSEKFFIRKDKGVNQKLLGYKATWAGYHKKYRAYRFDTEAEAKQALRIYLKSGLS